jgi:hypothetical protein
MLLVHDLHRVHAAMTSQSMYRDIPDSAASAYHGASSAQRTTHVSSIPHLPKGYVGAQRQWHAANKAANGGHPQQSTHHDETPHTSPHSHHMRSFAVGGATVTLGDPTTEEIPDYLITDAHLDYTRRGTVTAANLTVTIAFALKGNAYGKVARFRVTDKNNRTAVLMVRAMPTLYGINATLGQFVPEMVQTYASTVSEADPTFSDLSRLVPSTAATYVPLAPVGSRNYTAPVTLQQVSAAHNGSSNATGSGGASGRRLLQLRTSGTTTGGKCCSSTTLTTEEETQCFGTHPRIKVESMPYTVVAGNAEMETFCPADPDAQWEADLQAARAVEQWDDFNRNEPEEGRRVAIDNRFVCALQIFNHVKHANPFGTVLRLNDAIKNLLLRPEYAHFQIAKGQNTLQCVMAEPDAKGFPADTTGISCTPDFDRKLQVLKPGASLNGFYETIGAPCPCAPRTNPYFRSCTLNPWDAKKTPLPVATSGVVQKCAYMTFDEVDAKKYEALYKASGTDATTINPMKGQAFCMPYTTEKAPDENPWVDNLREDLLTEQWVSYKSCEKPSDVKSQAVNGAVLGAAAVSGVGLAGYALGVGLTGGSWAQWPVKSCPTVHLKVFDYSYRGNEVADTANRNVDEAVSLLALIGEQSKAIDLAKTVAIRAQDAIRSSRNVSLTTLNAVSQMSDLESASLNNMRVLNATASDLTARIQSSQSEVEGALSQVERQINDTRAQLAQFGAGSELFYSTANRSLALQQQLLDDQQLQLNYLLSAQKRNRQAIQDLTAAFSRFAQGRDKFRHAMRALHTTFEYARQTDGLFPFTTRKADGTGSFAPRVPTPEESNLVIDRSWVYFATASRPPRYNRSTTTMSGAGATAYAAPGTIWLTQQRYELRCSLLYLGTLTRINLTADSFKVMLAGDGCDPYASFGYTDPITNRTIDGSSNTCNCVVQVTESICATQHASASAYLAAINTPTLNAYMEPLGSTLVGTTGYAEAHACVNTTEWTLDNGNGAPPAAPTPRTFYSSVQLDPFLTETCVSRESTPMVFNAQWGPITLVTRESGQHVFNVPDWTRVRNATRDLVVPPISLTDYSSSILATGPATRGTVAHTVWNLATLTNASRTAQDWCTAVPRDALLQTSYTKLQLLPQRLYSYWPYVLMRFMASPFLKEMDLALNGRPPVFGANQVFRAYDNLPHPGDEVDLRTVPDSTPVFPQGNRTEFEAYLAELLESMRSYDRPFQCLEHNFIATGESMMPLFHARLRKAVRGVTAQFINSNGLVGAGGGAISVNISQADVDFFNAQLANRDVLESKSQSTTASESMPLLRGIETIVGYLSCKYDDEPCKMPRRAFVPQLVNLFNDSELAEQHEAEAVNGTRGWYTYAIDGTQLPSLARILAQRQGKINYIRTRVPVQADASQTPSIRELGWNSTQRRPMISAQTFLFEEVVRAVDPDTYDLLHRRLLSTSTKQPPVADWDQLVLTDPQLQSLLHQVLLSPTHKYDPMAAGYNPDAQRVPLSDMTDLSYLTDPDAQGVRCVTPAGHPNVISRRSIRASTGAQSDEEKFHAAFNVVRDVRTWPGGEALHEAGRDPDRADTWKTLWVVETSEVVSVTVVIGQAQIDQLFQVQTACPRNTEMHQATTAHPIVSLVRPGPDQSVTLRFNVTTASRNQSCDGIHTIQLPAIDPSLHQNVFDVLYVNFSSSASAPTDGNDGTCRQIRSVEMERIGMVDANTGASVAQTCWSWKMSGADDTLPAGTETLFRAQSTVDTDASFLVQRVAQQMTEQLDELDARTLTFLQTQLGVMEYAYANGVTLEDAEQDLQGGTPNSIDFGNAIRLLEQSINATVFNDPVVPVADPDAIIAQLRRVINQTELERLTDPNATLASSSNLYALAQTILREEAALQLLNNDTYYGSVTAPLIEIDNRMLADEFKRMVAVTANWIDNSTQVDWECMKRLEEAAFYSVSLDSGFPKRLRRMREAIRRQDEACRPAFHNFWMFGVVDRPTDNGPYAPDTTHFTGPFCSQAGYVGLEIVWMILMLALIMGTYLSARSLLIKMGTPGHRWYRPRVGESQWYKDWAARRMRLRAEYQAYVAEVEGKGPAEGPAEGPAAPRTLRDTSKPPPSYPDVASYDSVPKRAQTATDRRVAPNPDAEHDALLAVEREERHAGSGAAAAGLGLDHTHDTDRPSHMFGNKRRGWNHL